MKCCPLRPLLLLLIDLAGAQREGRARVASLERVSLGKSCQMCQLLLFFVGLAREQGLVHWNESVRGNLIRCAWQKLETSQSGENPRMGQLLLLLVDLVGERGKHWWPKQETVQFLIFLNNINNLNRGTLFCHFNIPASVTFSAVS